MLTVGVIGARRERQGTGHYLAAAFAGLGQRVAAIATTNDVSLRAALAGLRGAGIRPRGYTRAQTMLEEIRPDVLVIASPADSHLEYIRLGLRHRCHVLCEKPMFAPGASPAADAETCAALLRQFNVAGLCFALNTQWPQTLTTFSKLYPQLDLATDPVHSFGMRLCPESTGDGMLVDAAPHFLSMLYALCGAGEIASPEMNLSDKKLVLQFVLHHEKGRTDARLILEHRRGQPKPAEYTINGAVARRHIQMPGYLLSLENDAGARIAMRDPLLASTEAFIRLVDAKTPPDNGICHCMKQLGALIARAAEIATSDE